ncbi:MAG: PPOX class F420-dependent oxidoreductase [Chloroflexota bacterium]
MSTSSTLATLADQPTVILTTFRRDGRAVATPVSLAVAGEHGFVRTYASSGKYKRIRNNPTVEVAPATFRGRATGPAIRARARVLSVEEAAAARRLIEARHPWLHRLAVPIVHRLTGKRTVYLELRAA